MNTNTENRNELGNPTSFGVALGLLAGFFFGPAGAVVGFAAGATLGFWYDKKENHIIKPCDGAKAASKPKIQRAADCSH
ncbi:hypothetical protein SAMN05216327_11582 [Dyadobacter sp. SG02]|uniref:DUF456 domain-containing protein n=1 Tax=Dyadobacter sp. SG02 TaxID=1855291 RepID=UPI0008B762A3|nr:DUF456 domain-containing protein [Dyadobacter sp. SG02]SEJ65613.1 hypothetical protein SAMN05216327_11582 [Dyadobacter sp. SG02]